MVHIKNSQDRVEGLIPSVGVSLYCFVPQSIRFATLKMLERKQQKANGKSRRDEGVG